MRLFWLDTGWACGGIEVNDLGVIVGGAPVFAKLRGQRLVDVVRHGVYKLQLVTEWTRES